MPRISSSPIINHDAIDAGATAYVKVDVPESWKNCTDDDYSVEVKGDNKEVVDFVKDIQQKVNGQQGNTIPVSVVKKYETGWTPSGSIPYRNVCCNTTLLVCCCTGWSPACLVFLNNRYRNCVTLLSVDFLLNILNEVNNFLVVSLNFYRVIIICAVLPALWNIYLNVCCSTGIDCVVVP